MKLVIVIVALFAAGIGLAGCSKASEEGASDEAKQADGSKEPAAGRAPDAPDEGNSAASRADWSALFADGPCALTADEVAAAVGSDGMTMKATDRSCTYEDDKGSIKLSAHELDEAEVSHQFESVKKRSEHTSIEILDIGAPSVPTTWEPGARSILKMHSKKRLVNLSVYYPQIAIFDKEIPKEQKEAAFAERRQYADAIGRRLVAKAAE